MGSFYQQNGAVGRVLEALRARGIEARATASGWVACCPAHHDDRPSLSIAKGRDGRALLKCHAGCEAPAIVEALRLEMRDLFADTGRRR